MQKKYEIISEEIDWLLIPPEIWLLIFENLNNNDLYAMLNFLKQSPGIQTAMVDFP